MNMRFEPSRGLTGELRAPADKSISHRAALLGAMASEPVRIENYLHAADTTSTLEAVRALGALVEIRDGQTTIRGTGLREAREPDGPIDVGNAGTLMRLLPGWLAAQEGRSFTLDGDESIRRRPVDRIALPLAQMGAELDARDGRFPPLTVRGARLRAISCELPVASAQVKAAVLLAGLSAEGLVTVREPAPSRDHTERMLRGMGVPVDLDGLRTSLRGPVERLAPLDLEVPGDLSAAAFWLVAAVLHGTGTVRLDHVGVNPGRTGVLAVLERMGARVAWRRDWIEGGEPVADLEVGPAEALKALQVGGGEVAGLIDELPVLAVAAAVLPGVSRITGAAELRVKESDRVAAMAAGLGAMGANVTELPDGWEIHGPRHLEGARVQSCGDHRVAMALAIAGLLADGETEVEGAECVEISYPGFWDQLEALCSR
jgi:3-phosphoshikimate 1-carboxyvinyltransferase